MQIRIGESHLKQVIEKQAIEGRVDVLQLGEGNRFWSLAKALSAEKAITPQTVHRKPVIALDPGETTGLACWDPSSQVILLAQLRTKSSAEMFDKLNSIVSYMAVDKPELAHIRYEDYRVYGHMTEQHAFSHLHTARMCGIIEAVAHLHGIQWSKCLAMHAKTFWTDEKLKMCNLYSRGMRHARDAERHLLRYMGE